MFTYGPYLENLSTYKEGVAKGLELSRDEGRAEGRSKGIAEGKLNAKAEIAYRAYHILKTDLSTIKRLIMVNEEEEVMALINKYEMSLLK